MSDAVILSIIFSIILIGYVYYAQKKLDDTKKYYTDYYTDQIKELEGRLLSQKIKSTDTQRAVIKGQLAEQVYPLTSSYQLSDMRFMGMPIDYIIFDGYTETKDGDGHIREIIFADVKSGKAQLSKTQRSIKDAVSEGRVRWETITM